jgi:hypothetical protein
MPPRIGLGVSDFSKIREQGFVYIDKSLLVRDLIDDGAEAILLPRPRRFGKTTNLSMLRAYFERAHTDEDREARRALFAGLAISQAGPAYEAHFARYPTIALSFKDLKFDSFAECLAGLAEILGAVFKEHEALLPHLGERDADQFQQVLSGQAPPALLRDSLRLLTQLLHRHHRQRVLFLLDEYDTPLHASFVHGYYEQAVALFRNLLSAALKDNPHLHKGVLTGVLRIARDSIFTGLNHLEVYTLLRPEFAAHFGFTEEEVRSLLPQGEEGARQLQLIRDWYNGYAFGGQVVYNPWSVLSFVKSLDKEPRPYWAETSGNDLVREMLIEQGHGLSADMEALLRGQSIDKELVEQLALREAKGREELLWSLLLFTGYLKPVRLWRAERRLMGALAIPNQEVLSIYETLLRGWAEQGLGGGGKRRALSEALLRGQTEVVQSLVQGWLLSAVSFYDTASHSPPERFYHGFVLGLLVDLSGSHEVISNRESGFGRCDVLVVPRQPGRPGVALELKVREARRGQSVEQALAAAHEQLRQRDYAALLRTAGASPLHQMALVFDGKEVHVSSAGEAAVAAGHPR